MFLPLLVWRSSVKNFINIGINLFIFIKIKQTPPACPPAAADIRVCVNRLFIIQCVDTFTGRPLFYNIDLLLRLLYINIVGTLRSLHIRYTSHDMLHRPHTIHTPSLAHFMHLATHLSTLLNGVVYFSWRLCVLNAFNKHKSCQIHYLVYVLNLLPSRLFLVQSNNFELLSVHLILCLMFYFFYV